MNDSDKNVRAALRDRPRQARQADARSGDQEPRGREPQDRGRRTTASELREAAGEQGARRRSPAPARAAAARSGGTTQRRRRRHLREHRTDVVEDRQRATTPKLRAADGQDRRPRRWARSRRYMSQTWPGGGTPTQGGARGQGHRRASTSTARSTRSTVKTSGSSATISCKVSMLLADFPDKSVFGFLNGGATVTASSSQSDQDLASEDCVSAVIEDLIAKKIVPTICTKATVSVSGTTQRLQAQLEEPLAQQEVSAALHAVHGRHVGAC